MIKYFHELTERQYDKLVKNGMTYGELAKDYPQPEWCDYPRATSGVMGCWGLTMFLVHKKGKSYCAQCECNKEATPEAE